MVRPLNIIILSLILTLSGTEVVAQRNEGDIAAQQSILNDFEQVWRNNGITDYKYNYEKLGCPSCNAENYPWSAIVSTSPQYPQVKAIDVKNIDRGATAQKVEEIFNCVRLALRPQSQGGAEAVKVDYHDLGYPTKAVFIWVRDVSTETITMTAFEQKNGPPQVEYQSGRNLWTSQRIWTYTFTYFDYGPNTHGLYYPLSVSVQNQVVVECKQANGIVVNPRIFLPPTLDGLFDIIKRHLDQNAPYVDATYSKRGFPEHDLKILTWSEGFLHYNIQGFTY